MGGSNSVLAQEQFEAFANSLLVQPLKTVEEWSSLWEIDASEELIWKLCSLSFLRKLKVTVPFNFAALICQCLSVIANSVFAPVQPIEAAAHAPILLAVRILTRGMTVLASSPDSFERLFMWSFRLPRASGETAEDSQRTHQELVSLYTAPGNRIAQLVPGAQVVRLLTAALFLVGFTTGASTVTGKVPFAAPAPAHPAVVAAARHAAAAATAADSAHRSATAAVALTAAPPVAPLRPPAGDTPVAAPAPSSSSEPESAAAAATAAAAGAEAPQEMYVHLGKLWFGGVGPRVMKASSRDGFDGHRAELLRCLLACCSAPVYRPSATYRAVPNPYLLELCAPAHAMAPTLFVSLLNTVLSYCPAGQVLSYLPYAHSVTGDHREGLVALALGLLLVALDYDPAQSAPAGHTGVAAALAAAVSAAEASTALALGPSAAPAAAAVALAVPEAAVATALGETGLPAPSLTTAAGAALPPTPRAGAPVNLLRHMLSQFTDEDRRVTLLGLCELLRNPADAAATWLPNSVKRVRCEQELLVLLWHLLDISPPMLTAAVNALDAPLLLRPLLFFLAESRADPSRVVLLYVCVFLLLRLSGERVFCVALNARYSHDLPLGAEIAALAGTPLTYADVLVLSLQALVLSSPNMLDSLLSVVLTVLANISPFCTRLALPTALRLVETFEALASPRFLLAAEGNHAFVGTLLEVFNNLLQYQYAGNTGLVYAIVRAPRTFLSLRLPLQLPSRADLDAADAAADAADAAPTAPSAPPPAPARWRPCSEWARAWQSELPLATTLRLIEFIQPRLLKLDQGHGFVTCTSHLTIFEPLYFIF